MVDDDELALCRDGSASGKQKGIERLEDSVLAGHHSQPGGQDDRMTGPGRLIFGKTRVCESVCVSVCVISFMSIKHSSCPIHPLAPDLQQGHDQLTTARCPGCCPATLALHLQTRHALPTSKGARTLYSKSRSLAAARRCTWRRRRRRSPAQPSRHNKSCLCLALSIFRHFGRFPTRFSKSFHTFVTPQRGG